MAHPRARRRCVAWTSDRETVTRSTGVRWRFDAAPEGGNFEAGVLWSAPVAIVVFDIERDRVVSANRRAEALLGYARDAVPTLGLSELVTSSTDGLDALPRLRAAMAAGAAGEAKRCTFPLRSAQGTVHWVEARLDGTFENGSLVTCILTETPRSPEPESSGSSERLRLVLESTREGFWDWDIPSGRVFFSDQWLENLGYRPGDLPACVETWQALVHPDDAKNAEEVLRSRLDGRTPIEYSENRLLTKSGQYRWFADRGRVVMRSPSGAPLRMVGTDADITELKAAHDGKRQAEAHLARSERLASVGMMAAGVAHEINNPLAYILNNVDFALKSLSSSSTWHELDKEALSALSEAREGAVRVREVINDLRSFSRVGDERQWVDVREVLESSLNIARRQILECARLELGLSSARKVRANRSRLGQVLLNLLVNACEAIEPGRPEHNTISIGCRDIDGFVEVTVRDTGVGIPPGDIHRIFDLFYTTKPSGIGTGLGLSICHDLVEALGGSINVTSRVGVGTEFWVLLPVGNAEPVRPLSPPTDAQVWSRAKRMLVVDDDPLVARSVRRLLGDRQDVTLVHDGPSALAELRRATYDIVLCDVAMPGMDGLMVLEAAHSERLAAAHRFVFMTGSLFSQEWRQRMNAVGAPCVGKPLDMVELTAALAQVLAPRAPGRSSA